MCLFEIVLFWKIVNILGLPENKVPSGVDLPTVGSKNAIYHTLTVCIFTCVHLPIGAAGVSPSSPTLLFRRWVRKVESLISQPMTSGKNELQDHLIFISEKALHKRYFSFCQTSWSISWVYGMAYNLFLLNFMVLGDCNSRVSLCPTFSR